MHYKETIIELVGKIQSEKVLKRIYKFVLYLYTHETGRQFVCRLMLEKKKIHLISTLIIPWGLTGAHLQFLKSGMGVNCCCTSDPSAAMPVSI